MKHKTKWLLLLILQLPSVGILGCTNDGRVGVEGKVTYAGTPLDVATITFIPQSGSGIKTGGLIENGAYRIEPKFGPEPGVHRVEIRWAKATGKKYRNEYGEEIDLRQEGLPDQFHDKSTLSADLKSGTNIIDFVLEETNR